MKNSQANMLFFLLCKRAKHPLVEERTKKLSQWAENYDINRVEDNHAKIGVIVSGATYQYAKEALGDTVFLFKTGYGTPLCL